MQILMNESLQLSTSCKKEDSSPSRPVTAPSTKYLPKTVKNNNKIARQITRYINNSRSFFPDHNYNTSGDGEMITTFSHAQSSNSANMKLLNDTTKSLTSKETSYENGKEHKDIRRTTKKVKHYSVRRQMYDLQLDDRTRKWNQQIEQERKKATCKPSSLLSSSTSPMTSTPFTRQLQSEENNVQAEEKAHRKNVLNKNNNKISQHEQRCCCESSSVMEKMVNGKFLLRNPLRIEEYYNIVEPRNECNTSNCLRNKRLINTNLSPTTGNGCIATCQDNNENDDNNDLCRSVDSNECRHSKTVKTNFEKQSDKSNSVDHKNSVIQRSYETKLGYFLEADSNECKNISNSNNEENNNYTLNTSYNENEKCKESQNCDADNDEIDCEKCKNDNVSPNTGKDERCHNNHISCNLNEHNTQKSLFMAQMECQPSYSYRIWKYASQEPELKVHSTHLQTPETFGLLSSTVSTTYKNDNNQYNNNNINNNNDNDINRPYTDKNKETYSEQCEMKDIVERHRHEFEHARFTAYARLEDYLTERDRSRYNISYRLLQNRKHESVTTHKSEHGNCYCYLEPLLELCQTAYPRHTQTAQRSESMWIAKARHLALNEEKKQMCQQIKEYKLPFTAASLSVEAMEILRNDIITQIMKMHGMYSRRKLEFTRRDLMHYLIKRNKLHDGLAHLYQPEPSDVVDLMPSPAEAALVSYIFEHVLKD